MKSRMSLIFAALVVIMLSMVFVVRDRGSASDVVPAPMAALTVQAVPLPAPTIVITPTTAPAVAEVTVTPPAPEVITPKEKTEPMVQVATDGTIQYVAREGDTVSDLAVALLGSDSKDHRDAVIAANPSLQQNPDRVLEGYSYSMAPVAAPVATQAPVASAATAAPASDTVADATVTDQPAADKTATVQTPDQTADSARKLKYTAQPGDSVAVLAASLLGGDTKSNRDAVISSNASLQKNPDQMIAGKTYNIVTTSGLAAAASAPPVASTDQFDADDAARMSVGRVLRYVAQPGDTVSKLATVLLGSDTKANRDAIINNNHSLKKDPDHLVAGKTYWIAAPDPVADTTTP